MSLASLVSQSRETYWVSLAHAYAVLGPPLRPSGEDIRLMEQAVATWAAGHPAVRPEALLLGVTPDIANMRWPEATSLMAVENSVAMVRGVWPGNLPEKKWAVCADWLQLPRKSASCHIVVGDGSMNCVRYPDGFRALSAQVSDILTDGGIFVLRCFLQPARKERPEDVIADILREPIPTFHHFKFRLLMAMQRSAWQGIAVDEVYRFWVSRNLDESLLISRAGWEKLAIDSIKLYRGTDTVHTFPTLAEIGSVLHERFQEVSISTPSYNLGERCPILLLRPKRNA